jgi:hypothetical protein
MNEKGGRGGGDTDLVMIIKKSLIQINKWSTTFILALFPTHQHTNLAYFLTLNSCTLGPGEISWK